MQPSYPIPFTYNVATDIGRVRLLIPDRDPDNAILTDEEIQCYLDLNEGVGAVYYAAAEAVETIASDEVMVLKVIKHNDLQTDGASVARTLMARADRLRRRGDDLVAVGEPGFEVVQVNDAS